MKKLIFLWLFILFVYLLVAGKGKFAFHTTQRNFFSLQAYSFLQGRIDLVVLPKDLTDLSKYDNKYYLNWPPLTTLLILPFVAIYGINVSDIFYTAFYASFVPIILYLVLHEARKAKFIPQISDNYILLLALFFAFGTVFFYLSVLGTVWFTSQVISEIPLMLSLLFLFRSFNHKYTKNYFVSIVFLALSFWGRNTLILIFPLYLYVLSRSKIAGKINVLIVSLFIIFFSVGLFAIFNYYRFGSFIENGLGYHIVNSRWEEDIKKYGMWNVHYLPHNFITYFINPLYFTFKAPFIQPDPEGNSIFSTSPLFLLFIGIIWINIFMKKNQTLLIYLLVSVVILLLLLTCFSTGWFQFGCRYILDLLPLLILILAWVINKFHKIVVISLFIISVIINTLGTFWMQSIAALLRY